MNKTYLLILTLGLASPLAAELTAPQLPLIDAASVRAGLAEKENINIGAAFPGMQTCAFKAAEAKTCVFTCKDGSTVTRPALVSSLVPNGCAKFVMVPAGAPKAADRTAAGQVYAEGALYAYNRDTRQFDLATGRRCSVTLQNFRTYTDTDHGSPREVVSADYRLDGFSDLGKYTAGTAVGSAPDAYAAYVSLQSYLQSGLVKGIDVKIFIDNVASAQDLLARPARPDSVYVSKENSATSYFGGDGIKWGYWCDLRAARP